MDLIDHWLNGDYQKRKHMCIPHAEPCYYTVKPFVWKDFMDVAENNEEYAKELFDEVEWQSPQAKHDELMQVHGSIDNYLNGIKL